MKVKVGDKIYDGNNEPIMVILSKGEKEQIAKMHPNATKYCVYPNIPEFAKDKHKKIKAWMKGGREHDKREG